MSEQARPAAYGGRPAIWRPATLAVRRRFPSKSKNLWNPAAGKLLGIGLRPRGYVVRDAKRPAMLAGSGAADHQTALGRYVQRVRLVSQPDGEASPEGGVAEVIVTRTLN